MKIKRYCPQCNKLYEAERGALNRTVAAGLYHYCSRVCSGLAHRKHRSDEEKRALKSAYDAKRRIDEAEKIRATKREYHKRSYDPVKAAAERALKMPRHAEYCRRPEYKAWKAKYDEQYRAKKMFGPFWESAMLLADVETEVLSRASRYEIDLQNGKLNKRKRRENGYEKTLGG